MRREAVAGVIAILVVASLGIGYLSGIRARSSETITVTSISSVTTTTPIDSIQQVREAYLSYLQDVKSENASIVVDDYTNNATLAYEVNNPSGGMGGSNTGSNQIKQFYNQNIFFDNTMNLANESYIVSLSSNESEAIIHSNVTVYGESPDSLPNNQNGFYVANVALSIGFVHVGDDWLISSERWYDVNAVAGCQSFNTADCSILLSSPNWSQYIGPSQ
jgi:hypothetical protein